MTLGPRIGLWEVSGVSPKAVVRDMYVQTLPFDSFDTVQLRNIHRTFLQFAGIAGGPFFQLEIPETFVIPGHISVLV